jgi:hypothetical protein
MVGALCVDKKSEPQISTDCADGKPFVVRRFIACCVECTGKWGFLTVYVTLNINNPENTGVISI